MQMQSTICDQTSGSDEALLLWYDKYSESDQCHSKRLDKARNFHAIAGGDPGLTMIHGATKPPTVNSEVSVSPTKYISLKAAIKDLNSKSKKDLIGK